jgi:hypothetical protein
MSQTGVTDVGWRRHAWRNGAVETLGIAVRAYRRALAQSRKRIAVERMIVVPFPL